VEGGAATCETFVEAEGEVITLMSRDKLGRFKQSKEFEELMQQVGGYEVNARLRFKGGKKRGGSRIELKIHEPEATIPAPQSGRYPPAMYMAYASCIELVLVFYF